MKNYSLSRIVKVQKEKDEEKERWRAYEKAREAERLAKKNRRRAQ